MARRIISASRRTDIPAFYARWFLRRIEAGFAEWIRPFGGGIDRVSLRPEDTLAIVFWTRNPAPLLPALGDLRAAGYVFYVLFTITGYPKALESHGLPLDLSIRRLRDLAARAGPERVIWRYDPIVVSTATPPAYHLARFDEIAGAIEGATARAVISFADFYGKTRAGFDRASMEHGITFRDPGREERREIALQLRDIAARRWMSLSACCEDDLVGEGIGKAHCVDIDIVRSLLPDGGIDEGTFARRPTREGCGCTESIDIGAYDTCPAGCIYCYATRSRAAALARLREHDPADAMLWRPPG